MTNSPLTPRLCRAGLLLGLVMACSDGPHTPSPTLPGPPRVEPAPRSAEPAPEVAYAAAPAPPQGAGGEPAGPEAAEGGEVSRQAGETRGETANTPDPPPPPVDPPPPPEDPGGEEGEEEEEEEEEVEKKGEGEEEEENQPRQEYPCDSLGGASISARTNSDNPSTAVDLTWGFSTEPECEQDAVFNVTRGTDSVDFTAGETSTTDTPLDPGMRHCYTVTATTADGEFTSGACAWTNPATPTGFRAGLLSENDSAYNKGLQLNWNAVSIKDSYQYREKEGETGSYDPPESAGTGTARRVTRLTSGQEYCYQLRTVHGTRYSDWTTPQQCATVPVRPCNAGPPRSLTVTARSNPDAIRLGWNPPSNTENCASITYRIERASSSSGPFSEIKSTGGTTHTDTNVTCETTYYYRVYTVSDDYESSPVSGSATVRDCPRCAAPRVDAVPQSQTSIRVSWDDSTTAGCTTTISGGNLDGSETSPVNDTGLTCGTEYEYTATASGQGYRPSSHTDSATTRACVCDITSAKLRAPDTGQTWVDLNWEHQSRHCDSVVYDVSGTGISLTGTTRTSRRVTGLTPNTRYPYELTARQGSEEETDTLDVTTLPPTCVAPSPPSAPTASVLGDDVTISWGSVSVPAGCTSVHYWLSRNGAHLATTTGTTYADEDLSPGQYAYRVAVESLPGPHRSSEAGPAEVTVPRATPDPPTPPTCDLTSARIWETGKSQTWVDLEWTHGDNTHCDSVVYDVSGTGISLSGTADTSGRATGLAAGTGYTYTVTARQGSEQATGTVPVTTPVTACLPGTPGSLRLSTDGQRIQIGLDWDAPASVDCSDIRYRIDRRSGGRGYKTIVRNQRNTEFTDYTVACGIAYDYQVYAVGDGGVLSDPASASATRACPAPCDITGATIAATGQSQTWVELGWSHTDNGTCYAVQYEVSGTGISLSGTADTSGRATGLAAETEYAFTVTARQGPEVETGTVRVMTDPAGPAVPANMSAETVSAVEIRVTWEAAARADGYELQWSTDGGTNWSASIDVGAATGYDHTRLIPRTTYTYQARSRAGSGAAAVFSPWSQPPATATTRLLPVPENLMAMETSATSVRLSWDAVAGAEGYDLGRMRAGQERPDRVQVPDGGTTHDDTDLQAEVEYHYMVRSVVVREGVDYLSGWSLAVPVTPMLTVPEGLMAMETSATSVRLSWDAVAGAEGYDLGRMRAGAARPDLVPLRDGGTTHDDTGLRAEVEYHYMVRSVVVRAGVDQVSGWSDPVAVTPMLPETEPTATALSAVAIEVTWPAVAAATGYELWWRLGSERWTKEVLTAVRYAHDEGLRPGTEYSYQVRAVRESGGETAYSEWRGTSETTSVLPVPENLMAMETSATSVRLSWDAVAVAERYDLQRMRAGQEPPDLVPLPDGGTTHDDTDLQAEVEYHYLVRSVVVREGVDYLSGWSLAVPVTPMLTVPEGLMAMETSATSVRLSWDAVAGADGYDLERMRAGAARPDLVPLRDGGTTHDDTGLRAEVEYHYMVRSVVVRAGVDHVSGWSDPVAVTPMLPETEPTATALSAVAIEVTWPAVAAATGYELWWRLGSERWTKEVLTAVRYAHDEGLRPGTEYSYQVRAVRESGGETAYSEWRGTSETTNVLPVPGNLMAMESSATSVRLSWDAVAVAEGYDLERMRAGAARPDLVPLRDGATTHNDTGLRAEVEYQYMVRSVVVREGVDHVSRWSELVAVTPMLVPPTGLAATAVSASTIDLSWDASEGAASYEFQWKTAGAADWNAEADAGTGTSYQHTGREADTEYEYQVRAASGTHRSGWSGEASARTPAASAPPPTSAPPAPTGVTAEADSPFAVTVAWTAVADADSYTVRRQKVGESTWETMAASGESLADTDLAPETSYRYQVQSVRGALRSDWSSELTATTDEFTAPTEFTATAEGSTSMELTWEASPGTGLEYRVRWREPGGRWTTRRVSDTDYTVIGLTADTLYDFRIAAYKRSGSGTWHRTDAVDIEARTGTE